MEPSVGDYALIGDTRTAALCSSAGSIDWLCLPRFDSQPVFSRLIAGDAGGCFAITPDNIRATSRRYREHSAVLETTWQTDGGEARLTEGMVLNVSGALLPQALLVRRIDCLRGEVRLWVRFHPMYGLPGARPRAACRSGALVCSWGSIAVALVTRPELGIVPGTDTSVALSQGQSLTFVLGLADRTPVVVVGPDAALSHLEATDSWWRRWAEGIRHERPFRDAVVRSLITLRMLTYSPSGAPVAAPTTSVPELAGGARNWDYRFSWPRDASIGLATFLSAGKIEEAHSFMHWLLHASRLTRPRLQVLYTLFGKPGHIERELWDLPGYADSKPVRIGNAASAQHQLDVYGWVVDAAWLLVRSGGHLHGETWRAISGFADFVAKSWRKPDAGIWEVRGRLSHYVHSKVMAWLALDRALRIAQTHRIRPSRRQRWLHERDVLSSDIRERGFDRKLNAYVRAYGSKELDAALLILSVTEFENEASRLEGTVAAVVRQLGAGGPLLYRYPPGSDGLAGGEGAFLPCSFWLVQAVARAGDAPRAAELLEELMGFSNDVGLFSEEWDPDSNQPMGNFPQAFTHATLIQAALAVENAIRA